LNQTIFFNFKDQNTSIHYILQRFNNHQRRDLLLFQHCVISDGSERDCKVYLLLLGS